MGRAKANTRMQPILSRRAEPSRAAQKNIFLDSLLDFLSSLPAGNGELHEVGLNGGEGDERPAKRLRLATSPEAITILRDVLVIARPHNKPADHASFHREDVLPHLKLSLEKAGYAKPLPQLIISPRSQPNAAASAALLVKPEELSEALIPILAFVESWRDRDEAGAVWTSADISFERQGKTDILRVAFEVHWNLSNDFSSYLQWTRKRSHHARNNLLRVAFPDIYANPSLGVDGWSPQDFYEAAHVPDVDDTEMDDMRIPGLTCDLYPFQRRAIQWLLKREGVRWSRNKAGVDKLQAIHDVPDKMPLSFFEGRDVEGQICYVSPVFNVVTRDLGPFQASEQAIRGGILAEEMGLGKTVEIIGLILLHTRPFEPPKVFDAYTGASVTPTSGTLIVAPNALRDQWVSEIRRHAPILRVKSYAGIGRERFLEQDEEAAFISELATYDVVVTTYSVLAAELNFALVPPDRGRRVPRKYHRAKSPLVQISWWRVCMDEAQMIESGVSKAGTVARIIPRINAWGVTGTPVRDKVDDLYGLLVFLRREPFASVKPVWKALIESRRDIFRQLFNELTLRHTKKLVRNELAIPKQKRYVITMPFTAIEEQYYQSLFKELAEDCGLDIHGEPIDPDWDPEEPAVQEAMRTALDRLRKTALHPEVGARNREALGHRNGAMRTVAEVLDAMIEQSDSAMRTEQRLLLSLQLRRGQLLENSPRVKEALAIWHDVLSSSQDITSECRAQLQREIDLAKSVERAAAASSSKQGQDSSDDDVEEAMSARVKEARQRLRYALEIQHKATFFCANAYFQIKSNEEMTSPGSDDFKRLEEQETASYEEAKKIRKELLQESHGKASLLMKRLSETAANQAFTVIPELRGVSSHGIETRHVVDSLEELCEVLNNQANQLDDWREAVIQLLLKPLVDEEEDIEITGEEYEDSTKLQEEINVRIQVLRAAVADRTDTLLGTVNGLVAYDVRDAIRRAKEDQGPYPEKLLELHKVREETKPDSRLGSFRAIISELRGLTVKLSHEAEDGSRRASIELEIAQAQLEWTQAQFSEQQKISNALDKEITRFTAIENARSDYYRQLQAVSDMVAPLDPPKEDADLAASVAASVAASEAEEANIRKRMATAEAKHRYLLHLRDTDAKADEQRICVICQSPFTVGVLTVCGHQFCKECIMLWFRANHNCPVCKRQLHMSNLHDITIKPQELKVHLEPSSGGESHDHLHSQGTKTGTIYSEFSAEKLAEIQNIDLDGPAFTTKIDNLVRHLLWLRETDPGAKSIVFSQYQDFLNVLAMAFSRHRIGFASFDKPNGITKFKEDPSIECFLLHARAHASGLNLVNASHVFLCEPLVNTALELQAIARVHRIGQQQETTVWLYIVDGTVEESIYNLSVQRRLEHMGRTDKGKSKESTPDLLDVNLEAANSMELEHASLSKLMAKGKVAGEVVDKGDLWECLFGHVSRAKAAEEERLRSNPTVRGFLAGEAAEQRREEQTSQQPN